MPHKPEDKDEAAALRRVVGARIRHAREALGWSQEKLAEEVGVGVEMMGRYERASKFPSHLTLVRLARVLRVSTDVLLGVVSPSGLAVTVARSAAAQALDRTYDRLTASQQDAVTLVIRELTAPGGYARTKTRGRLER